MYCPSCGNEIAVELKYCNRCGANLSLPTTTQFVSAAPVKLAVPTIALGLTIVCGLGIIIAGAGQLAIVGVPPAALVWMVLFAVATLLGCTGLLIRFLTKMVTIQREVISTTQPAQQPLIARPQVQQLPPRFEPGTSVTENTTRTFSPAYTEMPDKGTREY
ncbi:MAG TPA: zinc ribbon domain-containing protein [Pyrinomonadaceae bacterium]|nr:zinc ribbon domain-containing protein [Pyrinomonadaceae bacterium]